MQPFLRFVVALFLSAFFIFGFVVVETFTFLGVVANAFIVTFICKEIAKKFFDNLPRRQQIAIAYFLSLGVLTAMFFMHSFGNNPEFMAKILFVYLPTYLMGWLIEDRAASLNTEIKKLKFSEFFGFYELPNASQAAIKSGPDCTGFPEKKETASSKKRLEELKEMMADGLIDEDDYEKKKNEILKSI